MVDTIETFYSLGLDTKTFVAEVDNFYVIQNRKNNKYQKWGPLLAGNPVQARFVRQVLKALRGGGPVRIIALKSRKAGISTAVQALFYHLCTHIPGFTAGVMAHEAKSTDWIFSIFHAIHQHMPKGHQPETRYGSKTEMFFGTRNIKNRSEDNQGLRSHFVCATAGGKNPLAGTTLRALHISEAAKMPGDNFRQMNVILNVLGAVPTEGPSLVVVESTANGDSGFFRDTFMRAWQAEQDGEDIHDEEGVKWVTFFAPWHEDPGNRMPAIKDWSNWPASDVAVEDDLRKRLGLDAEQLSFRRFKILNECGNDPLRFAQDWPSDVLEAFQASGSPAFRKTDLDRQLAVAQLHAPVIYKTTLQDSTDESIEFPTVVGW